MALKHWDVEINGKSAKARGKELKNALFAALQKHFSEVTGEEPLTITVKPIVKEEKVAETPAEA